MIPPSLDWVPLLVGCLNSAIDSISKYKLVPIKDYQTTLSIYLSSSIHDKNIPFIKTIIEAFAEANRAKIKELLFSSTAITIKLIVTLTHGPRQYNDPLLKPIVFGTKENSDMYKKREIV